MIVYVGSDAGGGTRSGGGGGGHGGPTGNDRITPRARAPSASSKATPFKGTGCDGVCLESSSEGVSLLEHRLTLRQHWQALRQQSLAIAGPAKTSVPPPLPTTVTAGRKRNHRGEPVHSHTHTHTHTHTLSADSLLLLLMHSSSPVKRLGDPLARTAMAPLSGFEFIKQLLGH